MPSSGVSSASSTLATPTLPTARITFSLSSCVGAFAPELHRVALDGDLEPLGLQPQVLDLRFSASGAGGASAASALAIERHAADLTKSQVPWRSSDLDASIRHKRGREGKGLGTNRP